MTETAPGEVAVQEEEAEKRTVVRTQQVKKILLDGRD